MSDKLSSYVDKDTVSLDQSNICYRLCIIPGLRRDMNTKSFNVWILCCDIIPLANARIPHTLHRSIIRPVLVGLSVAIALQKRQSTVRSNGLIPDELLMFIML